MSAKQAAQFPPDYQSVLKEAREYLASSAVPSSGASNPAQAAPASPVAKAKSGKRKAAGMATVNSAAAFQPPAAGQSAEADEAIQAAAQLSKKEQGAIEVFYRTLLRLESRAHSMSTSDKALSKHMRAIHRHHLDLMTEVKKTYKESCSGNRALLQLLGALEEESAKAASGPNVVTPAARPKETAVPGEAKVEPTATRPASEGAQVKKRKRASPAGKASKKASLAKKTKPPPKPPRRAETKEGKEEEKKRNKVKQLDDSSSSSSSESESDSDDDDESQSSSSESQEE